MNTIAINGHSIGAGCPTYIIAELSANHHQDFNQAVRLIGAAKKAGADAVKLQTYTPHTMTIDCDLPPFRIQHGPWQGRTLYDLYREAATPWQWHPALKAIAVSFGMDLFSTPFDETAVDFLERLNMPAYKVASFENGDIPLLHRIARTGKPVIMSTGMISPLELEESIFTLRDAPLALLHCVSAYPAPPDAMHLRTMQNLSTDFNVPVGLSDHTLGIAVPVAAVALGACIIEKHLTLSRSDPSPDSAFSLEPHEFRAMVDAVRIAEQSLGMAHGEGQGQEVENRIFRRSIFVVQDMQAGEPFTPQNVRVIRPAHGLHPRYLESVLRQCANQPLVRGTPLSWEHMKEK